MAAAIQTVPGTPAVQTVSAIPTAAAAPGVQAASGGAGADGTRALGPHQEPKAPSAPAMPGTRYALLIGIDDYTHCSKLRYCGADMQALCSQLTRGGFRRDHIFLLHDNATETALRPEKINIEEEINLVLSMVQEGDLMLVAFSGHGVQRNGASFLCPQDTRIDDVQSMIPLDAIFQKLQASRATHKVMLVDACRNDPRPPNQRGPGSPEESHDLFAQGSPPGIALLTSCSPGQVSREEPDFGHGVFMNYVLEGLQGRADANHDGQIGLIELCCYAVDRTKTYVAQHYHESQIPKMQIDSPEFELTRVPGYMDAPPSVENAGASTGPAAPQSVTNKIGMKLNLIPAGEFFMGAPNWDKAASANERPAHLVRITRPFYCGAYKVTRQQFRKFVTDTNYKTTAETEGGLSNLLGKGKNWIDPGFCQEDEHPVVCITWEDASRFCAWLTAKEHVTYRLPTEAEWEYVCRAGSEARFFFGNDEAKLLENAWFFGNGTAGATHPVGLKKPNAWGLYDVAGNAMEWCSDWYDKSWYDKSPKNDPVGPETGTLRVMRGAWFHAPTAEHCRSAKRSCCPASTHVNGLGFRVVMELP